MRRLGTHRPPGDARNLGVTVRPGERQAVLQGLPETADDELFERVHPIPRVLKVFDVLADEIAKKECRHQLQREQRLEQIDRIARVRSHGVCHAVDFHQL
ncbi:hypothetical protein FQZ97_1050250 [compost metagenome]